MTFSAREDWAVELRGEALDLDDLREALAPPFSPWIEDYESEGQVMLLLRSANWRFLESAHAVLADARRLIDQINAAQVLAHADARNVVLSVALRFDAAGQRLPVIVAGSMEMTLGCARCRARFSVVAGVTMIPPSPSAMQQRLGRAERDEAAADLLGLVARADNWFDLFKAMETIERLVGDARAVQQHDRTWKRIRQAANRHRHPPSPKYRRPTRQSISTRRGRCCSALPRQSCERDAFGRRPAAIYCCGQRRFSRYPCANATACFAPMHSERAIPAPNTSVARTPVSATIHPLAASGHRELG